MLNEHYQQDYNNYSLINHYAERIVLELVESFSTAKRTRIRRGLYYEGLKNYEKSREGILNNIKTGRLGA